MKSTIPGIIISIVLSTVLRAEPVTIQAEFDPAIGPNQYVVDFSALGGSTLFMPISGGRFSLRTDALLGTAVIEAWEQDVAPIEILPGKSTGPIKILLEEGSATTGTYDAATRTFSAGAGFRIEFDDSEVQELGFASPMILEGVESGTIYGEGSIGSIHLYLEGEGLVSGMPFNYSCQTTARFDYLLEDDQAQPGDVTHDHSIDLSDAVSILGALFQGSTLDCEAAAEVNRDDAVDLSDAIYLLGYLFLGGPSIPAEPVQCTTGGSAP